MLSYKDDTLLIGLGARFYRYTDRLYVENQTISGLKAWQENFRRVIAFSILVDKAPPKGWSDAQTAGLTMPDFELVPLPDTYRTRTLRRSRREAETALIDCMERASFRVFSYGGWIGDPGEIAAALARKHGLSHAVWLDRVESRLVRQQSSTKPISKMKSLIKSQILSRYENRAVRTADLALLHGATVFNHFKGIARNPQVAENIHLRLEDRITNTNLSKKLKTVKDGPLRILYCGRAEPMKGGHEWVRTLVLLRSAGVEFRATWIGTGSQLDEIERQARQDGLTQEEVSFPGFLEDRNAILQNYRQAHVLMFCHKTDESPRNLIESLHSATPIVGFRDAYAEGLVNEEGGGILVKRGDVDALAKSIATLAVDREKLADLIEKARRSANHLTREQVFRQRSDLVRLYLSDT
jgi:glycosyltransferase involved in cell wall biosynthesis